MDQITIRIRPAGTADLSFLVWAMRTAATSHLPTCVWDSLIGSPSSTTDELLAAVAQSDQPHWCHLSRFWLAEVDGEPVGAWSEFDTATEGSVAFEAAAVPLLLELDLHEDDLQAVLGRADVLRSVTPIDTPGSWGIENVAVIPAHRGRGVVSAMFAHALTRGRDQRHRTAQILCLDGNDRAQRAWEREGFTVQADYRDERFHTAFGSRGMKLLTRALRVEDDLATGLAPESAASTS